MSLKNTKTFLLITLIAVGIFGVGFYARAQGSETLKQLRSAAESDGAGLPVPQPPQIIIATVIRSLLGLIGIGFVGMMVYSGFLWMTAGGNDEQQKKATSYIFNSVIGLIIILSAYMITTYAFRTARLAQPGNCTSNNACGNSEKCNVYGQCVNENWCESSDDCGSEYACVNGACIMYRGYPFIN